MEYTVRVLKCSKVIIFIARSKRLAIPNKVIQVLPNRSSICAPNFEAETTWRFKYDFFATIGIRAPECAMIHVCDGVNRCSFDNSIRLFRSYQIYQAAHLPGVCRSSFHFCHSFLCDKVSTSQYSLPMLGGCMILKTYVEPSLGLISCPDFESISGLQFFVRGQIVRPGVSVIAN